MNLCFIALQDGNPIACAHIKEDLEEMLRDYSKGLFLGYIPYPVYNNSVNCFQGTYYFKKDEKDMVEFKIYSVMYKKEKNG